jgi:hypothetical protein
MGRHVQDGSKKKLATNSETAGTQNIRETNIANSAGASSSDHTGLLSDTRANLPDKGETVVQVSVRCL